MPVLFWKMIRSGLRLRLESGWCGDEPYGDRHLRLSPMNLGDDSYEYPEKSSDDALAGNRADDCLRGGYAHSRAGGSDHAEHRS